MPRTHSRLPLLAVLLAAQAGLASAQQSAPAPAQPPASQAVQQSTQNQAPPRLERVEPGSDVPASTIPSRTRTQIKETRGDGGQVSEVEVNSSGSHYYLKPNGQPGNAVPGSVTGNQARGPQWKVGEFDLSGKRKAAGEVGANAPATADAPPPPPPPPAAGEKK